MTEKDLNTSPASDDAIRALEERLLASRGALATVLQLLADGKPLGGALVGRHGPRTDEDARVFAEIIQAHDRASGSLWEALRSAGFEVVDLPEAIYGVLTPETR